MPFAPLSSPRRCLRALLACGGGSLLAQTATPTVPHPAAKPDNESPVMLSPFEVRTDGDVGYTAASALAGGRTDAPLKLTSAAISGAKVGEEKPWRTFVCSLPLGVSIRKFSWPRTECTAHLRLRLPRWANIDPVRTCSRRFYGECRAAPWRAPLVEFVVLVEARSKLRPYTIEFSSCPSVAASGRGVMYPG